MKAYIYIYIYICNCLNLTDLLEFSINVYLIELDMDVARLVS